MRGAIKFEVLNCKKVETALKRAEKQLIKYAKELVFMKILVSLMLE